MIFLNSLLARLKNRSLFDESYYEKIKYRDYHSLLCTIYEQYYATYSHINSKIIIQINLRKFLLIVTQVKSPSQHRQD